jgi:hypothetical protein
LDAFARASSPSQPKSWQKIRYRSLNIMLEMIAGLHSPRRKPQVNAMDQVFGTDRHLLQRSSRWSVGRDPHAQAQQLALDALVAPARVLPGQAGDQLLHVRVQRWSADPVSASLR